MKRFACMLLVLALCLIVVGCRRGSASPRKPAPVDKEKDFIPVRNENERLFEIRPKDRKVKIWLESIYQTEANLKKDRSNAKKKWSDMVSKQEDMEKKTEDKNAAQMVTKLQSDAGKEEAELEFKKFAPEVYKYLKMKKATPKEFNRDEFYKYCRQEKLVFLRKYLDKVDMEVVDEEIRLIRFLDDGSITFVPDVDMLNENDVYIIAHRGAGGGMMGMGGMGGGGGMPAGGGGPGGGSSATLVWFNKENGFSTMPGKDLTLALHKQDLKLLRLNFIAYAGPLYMRAPADGIEKDQWVKAFLPPNGYPALMKDLPYQNPIVTLGDVEAKMRQLMKNPPEVPDIKAFKKHLKENAPPTVLGNLESRVYGINPAVTLRADDILAVRTELEIEELENNQKRTLGHKVIHVSGLVRYASGAEVKAFLPPPPETKGMLGMGMPPGGKGGPPLK